MELPARGSGTGFLDVRPDVVEDQFLGFGQRDRRAAYLVGQPGPFVHLLHDLGHRGQRVVVGVDHDVHTLAEHVEIAVGNQRGDFDEFVASDPQTGHFAIDPNKFVLHESTE